MNVVMGGVSSVFLGKRCDEDERILVLSLFASHNQAINKWVCSVSPKRQPEASDPYLFPPGSKRLNYLLT